MHLAVSMWSYFRAWKAGRLDVAGFIREAKSSGADGVELLDFFGPKENAEYTAVDEALAETGLPVPIYSVAQNFAKVSTEDRDTELAKIRFGIHEAQRFGAKVVRVFAGDVSEGITYDMAREWIVEGLSRASLEAHEAGVRLALENHGTLAGQGDQVVQLIEDVRQRSGVDALWANPDTGNFFLIDPPSEIAVAKVASYAAMVHFKDFRMANHEGEGFIYGPENKRFAGTALGEGEVNIAACISELKAAGFDGWLSLEYEGEEDPMTAVPRSLAFGRQFL